MLWKINNMIKEDFKWIHNHGVLGRIYVGNILFYNINMSKFFILSQITARPDKFNIHVGLPGQRVQVI